LPLSAEMSSGDSACPNHQSSNGCQGAVMVYSLW
jgi:hypothetical protein